MTDNETVTKLVGLVNAQSEVIKNILEITNVLIKRIEKLEAKAFPHRLPVVRLKPKPTLRLVD